MTLILLYTDSPSSQTVLEIHFRWGGLPIYSPPIRTASDSTHFYQVHVCGSLPSETDENPCHELPRWLAGVSQVGARALCLRLAAPYGSPEASWAQDQLSQELPVSHRCLTAVPPLEGPMPVLGRCPIGTQSRAACLPAGESLSWGQLSARPGCRPGSRRNPHWVFSG